tara:strand:+ start:760 stop:1491 length:732 start_codon:yes stop_codon:yes gene_type:complete
MLQELYEKLNDSSFEEEHEKIFAEFFNKFLEIYYPNKINSNNFVNFKEDTYLVFNGLYLYLFQEDINNQEDITEEETDKFNDMKNHVEYIIHNIKDLEYEENNKENPLFSSLIIVMDFVNESLKNIKDMNEIMQKGIEKLEDASTNLEMIFKLKEITENRESKNIDTLKEYRKNLDDFLKKFSIEQKILVIKGIENNVNYEDKIKNCQDNELIKNYSNLLQLSNIITLKSIINKNIKSNSFLC